MIIFLLLLISSFGVMPAMAMKEEQFKKPVHRPLPEVRCYRILNSLMEAYIGNKFEILNDKFIFSDYENKKNQYMLKWQDVWTLINGLTDRALNEDLSRMDTEII